MNYGSGVATGIVLSRSTSASGNLSFFQAAVVAALPCAIVFWALFTTLGICNHRGHIRGRDILYYVLIHPLTVPVRAVLWFVNNF